MSQPPAPASVGCCGCTYCFGLTELKDLEWARKSAPQLLLAGCVLGLAFILRSVDHYATIRGNYVFRWAFLGTLIVAAFLVGRVLNWIVFKTVSALSAVHVISTPMYYMISLDDVVQHLTWISVGVSHIDIRFSHLSL